MNGVTFDTLYTLARGNHATLYDSSNAEFSWALIHGNGMQAFDNAAFKLTGNRADARALLAQFDADITTVLDTARAEKYHGWSNAARDRGQRITFCRHDNHHTEDLA